jgi:6,7-dimethyl-8-ribityllumazine synthase
MDKKQDLSSYDPSTLASLSGKKIAIITAQWNVDITHSMTVACMQTLLQHGIQKEDIRQIDVAGSFELPYVAQYTIRNEQVDAVICIGCIIQGETRHFEFIAQATANGIMQVGLQYEKPVLFGVLTTNNMQQAIDRSGGTHGNKGVESAVACLKLLAI